MDALFKIDEIAEWMRSYGLWAILISLLINIIIAIFGFVPTLFLSGANAIVFGLIPGFFLSLIGEIIGAAVSFWLYRWGFGKLKQVKNETWGWLQRFNETGRRRRAVILFIARLTPLVPSGVITFAAAISRMHFADFIIITLFGKAPSIAMETLVGHDLIRFDEQYPRLLISLFCLILIFLLFRKRRI